MATGWRLGIRGGGGGQGGAEESADMVLHHATPPTRHPHSTCITAPNDAAGRLRVACATMLPAGA